MGPKPCFLINQAAVTFSQHLANDTHCSRNPCDRSITSFDYRLHEAAKGGSDGDGALGCSNTSRPSPELSYRSYMLNTVLDD